MRFEWDKAKNAANVQKHGIDFKDAVDVFNHPMLTAIDTRFSCEEERWVAIGLVRQIIGVVVYTERCSFMNRTSKTDWKRLAEQDDESVDTSDIPELDDGFFEKAELRVPEKKPVTLRIDEDVLTWFKSQGRGYQTRINKLLRQYMESQSSQR